MSSIKKLWYNPKVGGSYAGASTFYISRDKKYRLKDIKEELGKLKEYYTFLKRPRRFPKRKVIVHFANFMYCADLIDLQRYHKDNAPYNYILVLLDMFSRKLYAFPLASKKPENVIKAFKKFLKVLPKPLSYLTSDRGVEFVSRATQEFLKKENIIWYTTGSELKSVLCERVNQTLMGLLYKIFSKRKSFKYKDVLDNVVHGYNNRYHSSIKATPNFASKKENEDQIWKTLYEKEVKRKQEKPKLEVGTKVLIKKLNPTFYKGYVDQAQKEEFTLVRIRPSKPPMYYLQDKEGEDIAGGFYFNELIIPPQDGA